MDRLSFIKSYHELMKKNLYTLSMLVNANRFADNRKEELCRSLLCGCYGCLVVFLANDVRFDEDGLGRCPFCGSRHILGQSSAYPLDKGFLKAMQEYHLKGGQDVV